MIASDGPATNVTPIALKRWAWSGVAVKIPTGVPAARHGSTMERTSAS
jgi:hypothetical protein